VRLVVLAVLSLAACGSSGLAPNELPEAELGVTPSPAQAGEEVLLDGSLSTDTDGQIVSYRILVSDGTPELAGPVAAHRFPRGGQYAVLLVVTDDRGGEARSMATVTVLEDNRPPAPCDSGWDRCDGACVDTTTDPAHCGGCDQPCATVCEDSACLPSGAVLTTATFPLSGDYEVSGLSHDGERFWALVNRRHLYSFVPGGEATFEATVDESDNFRAMGLAALGDGEVAVGAFRRGAPFGNAGLLFLEGGLPSDLDPENGGAVASDGELLYVFRNGQQDLLTIDRAGGGVLSARAVTNAGTMDRFSDLALDGNGNVWVVRPREQDRPAAMKKISLGDRPEIVLEIEPPDERIGGVVLVDGVLWGAGGNTLYGMVP
jgi:hypothetical protein